MRRQEVEKFLYKETTEQRKQRLETQGGARANRPQVFDDKRRKRQEQMRRKEYEEYC